jgi:hypothetical protein
VLRPRCRCLAAAGGLLAEGIARFVWCLRPSRAHSVCAWRAPSGGDAWRSRRTAPRFVGSRLLNPRVMRRRAAPPGRRPARPPLRVIGNGSIGRLREDPFITPPLRSGCGHLSERTVPTRRPTYYRAHCRGLPSHGEQWSTSLLERLLGVVNEPDAKLHSVVVISKINTPVGMDHLSVDACIATMRRTPITTHRRGIYTPA